MPGEGASLRSYPGFAGPGLTVVSPAADRARDQDQLLRSARLVRSAFAEKMDAGELDPRQFSALLQLDRALSHFADPASGTAGHRPPGTGDAHPCSGAGQASPSSRPAADLTPGDERHAHAMGRPGAE